MLGYIWILLFILMGAFSLSMLFHKRIGVTIPSFLFIITLYLYLSGIFFPLNIMAYIGIGITIITFIIALLCAKKEHFREINKLLLDPVLWLFIVLFFSICFINYGKHISYIDEYTHWGDVVKAMYQNQTLAIYQDNSWYASYPPAMSLLQYFFMLFQNTFREDILYIVSQIFMISLCLPFIKQKKFSSKFWIVGLILLISPMIFTVNYYDNIYVDAYLGILFAHNMAYIFHLHNLKKYDIFYLTISFMVLILLKDIGFFLVLMNCAVLLYTCVKRFRKKLSTVLFMIAITLLTRFSFSMLLSIQQVTLQHQEQVSISQIISILLGNGTALQNQVISNFIDKVCNSNLIAQPISFNYISILVVLFGLLYGFQKYYLKEKTDKLWWKQMTIWLMIGAIIYLFGLLGTYLFQMNADYAVNLSSYNRYITIFINGIFYFVLLCFLSKEHQYQKLFTFLLILICVMPMYQVPSMFQKREQNIQTDIMKLGEEIPKTVKLVIYDSNGELYDRAKIHYYIRPYELGEEQYITNAKQLSQLEKYDYLYIYRGDILSNYFLEEKYHIKPKEKQLYRIQNDKLILEKKYN